MDAIDTLNPITATVKATEYVQAKFNPPKYPSALPPAKQKKFEEMMKQDFYKDDPYKSMWDSNWIYRRD